MPINLETPKKFAGLVSQAHMVATEVFRPNSRKYDDAEHSYPKELDMLAAAIDGMNESGALGGAGAGSVGGNGIPTADRTTTARCQGSPKAFRRSDRGSECCAGAPAYRDAGVL